MKTIAPYIAAAFALFFATAVVASPVIVDGCAVTASAQGGFSIKVDPSCVFASEEAQDDFTKDWTDLDFAKK